MNVLAIAESRVIYRLDFIGAERESSTMESLQQATDGDGQRRNTQRYQESNNTRRRYVDDEQVRKRRALWDQREVADSTVCRGT